MANEFDRQEKVSDYDNFVSKKDSQINFNEEFQKINTTVKGIAVGRETKKAKLQSDTDSVISELEKAQKNSNQTLGQTVLKQAANAKKVLLQQNKLLKAGYISPSEYMQILQTAKDDMANWGIANKMWSTEYDLSQTRQQTGKDGNKIASAVETNMNNAATGFNNLNDVEPFTAPSGASFMVRMVIDKETGERTMPSYDDKPENYLPMSSINNLMLYRDDSSKYNVGALVKKKTDLIGTFVTAVVGKYDTLEGGGIVLTQEGARKMDVFLKTEGGKSAFDELKKDTVNLILNDNLSIANVLAQQTGSDPKKKYILAGSEQEFVDAGGTDISKWIKIDRTSVPPSFPDISDTQRKAAEDIVEREFRTQIGASSKQSNLKSGQQENASTSKVKQEDIDDAGYIQELNDAFTSPNSARSKAIIQRLVDTRNAETNKPEERIRAFNITPDAIVVKRGGGLPDLYINRITDSGKLDDPKTEDIDESLDVLTTRDDIMAAINILTPGKGYSGGRVDGLIDSQKIILNKRDGSKSVMTSTPEKELNLITNTKKLPSGKTLIGALDAIIGDETKYDYDSTVIKAIDDTITEAMSRSLKVAIRKRFEGAEGEVRTEEVSNIAGVPMSSQTVGEGEKKEQKAIGTGVTEKGQEYYKIEVAGFTEYVRLSDANTKQNIADAIVRIINSATKAVNARRSDRNKKLNSSFPSRKDWLKDNPGTSYKDYQAARDAAN